MASRASVELLRSAITGRDVAIDEVRRARGPSARPGTPTPVAAGDCRARVRSHRRPRRRELAAAAERDGHACARRRARLPRRGRTPSIAPLAAAGPGARRARAQRAVAALGQPDRARRHPQARSPDERRRRARDRARRAIARAHRARAHARDRARASSRTSCTRLHRTFERHLAQMQSGILEVRMVPARPGLRQARARRPADLARARQGGEPRHHRRRDGDRQAHRRGAQRSADAHDPQRDRSRHRAARRAAGASASRRSARSRSTPSRRATTSSSRSRTTARGMDPEALLEAAVRRGVVDAATRPRELSPREVLALVFMPGLHHEGRGDGLSRARRRDGRREDEHRASSAASSTSRARSASARR